MGVMLNLKYKFFDKVPGYTVTFSRKHVIMISMTYYFLCFFGAALQLVYSKLREVMGGNLDYIGSGGAAASPKVC